MKSSDKTKKLDSWHRERSLFKRDKNGELMFCSVPILGSVEEEVLIRPLTCAELDDFKSRTYTENFSADEIRNFFFKKCLHKMYRDQIDFMKHDYYNRIFLTILFECGYDIIDDKSNKIKDLRKKNKSKKSERRKLYELIRQDNNRGQESALLHELGYTFFNIPNLTVREKELVIKSELELRKKTYGGDKKGSGGGKGNIRSKK